MRTVVVPLAIAGALCAGAATARADQCAWIDADVAERAARELARASKVIEYCEPCGEPAPGEPREVGGASFERVDTDAWQVLLDERGIDLAYTYVLAPGAHEYRNLAALAGCPAQDVSPTLRIDTATASGVLIQGDSKPVRPATPPPLPEPPPAPAPLAPSFSTAPPAAPPRLEAPQPTVIVIADERSPRLDWIELLLGATLLANALFLLAFFRRRGPTWHRVDLPRATKLSHRD